MRALAVASVLLCCGVAAAERPPEAITYVTALRHELGTVWRPLPIVRAQIDAGELGDWVTVISVTVTADGTLREVHVTSSSGLPAFDDEVLRTFRAVHYPVAPPVLLDANGLLEFPWTMQSQGPRPPEYIGDPLGRTPATGNWAVGTSFDLDRHGHALNGGTSIATTASYQRSTFDLMASYAFAGRWLVELNLPISSIHYRDPASSADTTISGLGDATLHLHHATWFRGWFGNAFLGVELPTGPTRAMPIAGTALPTVVQLGSGTFNLDGGTCANVRLTTAGSIGACDHWRLVFYESSHGYRDPFLVDARLFVSWSLFDRRASIRGGLLFDSNGGSSVNGTRLADTGYNALLAEASIWVTLYRNWSLRSTFELPLVERVTGTQLADSFRLSAGLVYDFDR